MAGGLRFGRYESLFRIAAGGMAEVHAARLRAEAGFQKLVAVKRILPVLGDDEEFTRMFLEEARVSAQLASPHIVQTLDLGRDEDGLPYLVQELVIGVDLVEVMTAAQRAGRPIPVPIACEAIAQAAVGLHDAHEARTPDGRRLDLVHRDVSPHNLIVGVDGRVRLTDFGVARVAFDRLIATRTGVFKGKLAYLAPEQATPGGSASRASDIFGLGIVAWELLAGARLFQRATPLETLNAVRRCDVPLLTEARPALPASIAEVVHAALVLEPEHRTPSARRVADDLRAAAREAGLGASETDIAELLSSLAPPRLVALRARLHEWSANPAVETLADIELPPEDPEEEIDTVIDVASDGPSISEVSTHTAATRPLGAPKRPSLHEAETARLGARRRLPLGPIVLLLVGLAMGAAAIWIFWAG